MRERESLFNEYLLEVRKREKDEKAMRREQVCNVPLRVCNYHRSSSEMAVCMRVRIKSELNMIIQIVEAKCLWFTRVLLLFYK